MNKKLLILLVAATLANSGHLQAQTRQVALIGTPEKVCNQEAVSPSRNVAPTVRGDWVQGCIRITNQILLPCIRRAEAKGLKGNDLGAEAQLCQLEWNEQLLRLPTRERPLPFDPTKPGIPMRPPGG